FASHSIRTALEREQVVLHIRAKLREDGLVALRQIEFRVGFVGPKNLVWMRDPLQCISVAGLCSASARSHGHTVPFAGRRTSSGRLSSRNPRKTGWRNLRSA